MDSNYFLNSYGEYIPSTYQSVLNSDKSSGTENYVLDLTKLKCFKPLKNWANKRIEKWGDLFADNYAIICAHDVHDEETGEDVWTTEIFGGDRQFDPDIDQPILSEITSSGWPGDSYLRVHKITGDNPQVIRTYDEESGEYIYTLKDLEYYSSANDLQIPQDFFKFAINTLALYDNSDSNYNHPTIGYIRNIFNTSYEISGNFSSASWVCYVDSVGGIYFQ